MIHPSLSQWQQAKKSAMALASHMGAEIIQTPDGKEKRVFFRGNIVPCLSWYAAYCYLHRIALDRIANPPSVPIASPGKPVAASKPVPPPVHPPNAALKAREPPRGVYVDLDGNEILVAKFC